jgi:hypothetical protein
MLSLVASLFMCEFRRHVVISFSDLFRAPLPLNIYFNLSFRSYTSVYVFSVQTFSWWLLLSSRFFALLLYPAGILSWLL